MISFKRCFLGLCFAFGIGLGCEPEETENVEFREGCPFWFRPKACGYDCPGPGGVTMCVNMGGSTWECSSCDAAGGCDTWTEKSKNCPLI